MKKWVSIAVKILITSIVLYFIFRNIEYQKLRNYFDKFEYAYYWTAFFLYILLFLFHFLKWRFLLIPLGVNLPFLNIAMLCWKGLFFNLFLPTSIGGDVVRMYDTNKLTGRWSPAVVSIFFERILGFFSISLLGIIMVFFKHEIFFNDYWKINLLLFPLLLGIILTLFFSRRFFIKFCSMMIPEQFRSKIDRLFELFENYRKNLKFVLKALLSVMCAQCLNAVVFYLIFSGNSESAACLQQGSLYYFVASLSIIYVMSSMPSVGGLGVREGAFVAFFMSIGFPKEAVIANSLIVTSILYLVSSFGVIPFLAGYPSKRTA